MRPGIEADKRGAAAWEFAGLLFILVLGSAAHFAFALSGEFAPLAPLLAVNESVWEHLKLAFWPALLWAVLERQPLVGRVNNFLLAKSTGILLMPITIVVLFYSYTSILGDNLLALDIASFVIAIVVGQYVSYRLLTGNERNLAAGRLAVVVVILAAVSFAVFTFAPPHIGLFMDGPSGHFGILS